MGIFCSLLKTTRSQPVETMHLKKVLDFFFDKSKFLFFKDFNKFCNNKFVIIRDLSLRLKLLVIFSFFE